MLATEAKLKIDAIDDEIARLYAERMELAAIMNADTARDVSATE